MTIKAVIFDVGGVLIMSFARKIARGKRDLIFQSVDCGC
jgi:phosphoglycolate phosphatase-like HAD superfamily hydrolase